MEIRRIRDRIEYVEASDDPLSADIGIVRGESGVWLYDVGNGGEAVAALTGRYNVVLSHFHADHTGNLSRLDIERLYVSPSTFSHTKRGIVVQADVYADDLHIFPLPSSHARGCLGLEVGNYAFVGDALYGRAKGGRCVYNVQLLKEEIGVLQSLGAEYLLVSHQEGLVAKREDVLGRLEEIYATKDKSSSLIPVEMA